MWEKGHNSSSGWDVVFSIVFAVLTLLVLLSLGSGAIVFFHNYFIYTLFVVVCGMVFSGNFSKGKKTDVVFTNLTWVSFIMVLVVLSALLATAFIHPYPAWAMPVFYPASTLLLVLCLYNFATGDTKSRRVALAIVFPYLAVCMAISFAMGAGIKG